MKVVVVEDQSLFKDFLLGLLRDRFDFTLSGVAGDGETALTLIREHAPDLVLLDILIPKRSGIQVARIVREELPKTRIIAISAETDLKTIHQVHQFRPQGFINKNEATVESVVEAIRTVINGQRYVSEGLQKTITQFRTDPKAFQKILTRREQEILSYIGGGLSDEEIGGIFGLSPSSVQSHRRNLFRKLDVHSTPELIRFAQEAGFWKPSFRKMGLSETYHVHE